MTVIATYGIVRKRKSVPCRPDRAEEPERRPKRDDYVGIPPFLCEPSQSPMHGRLARMGPRGIYGHTVRIVAAGLC